MLSVPDVNAQTIEAVRAAIASGGLAGGDVLRKDATTQGFSTSTGLNAYNLEAAAKVLVPFLSPLRNRFPRQGGGRGTAVNWKAITGVNTTKIKAGVAEGLRNSVISTSEVDKLQAYKDFGLDDSTTFDAQDAGQGFDDIRALSAANLLAGTMVEEEKILLGGNVTAIGAPTNFAAADSNTAGSLSGSTQYDLGVSALTLYGYLNGATGASSADETDAALLQPTTGSGKTSLDLTWTAVRGAVAYNVYAAAHSATLKYSGTTTTNTYHLSAIPGSGHAPNGSDLTADALSFDGVIPQVEVSGSGAYYKSLDGAALTGDNAGGVAEIDTMLKSLWDNSRIGPTLLLVNSQEAMNITKKVMANGSTTTLRQTVSVGADGVVTAGLVVSDYLNKFTGPRNIPIEIHPYLPPGTIIAISERLPFPRSNVPAPFAVDVRREYTQYDWAITARKWEYGVYGTECLKVYFPAGCGVLANVANG